MTRALLQVVQAGPHVTVQDMGRPGMMRFGLSASGPMDRTALAIANAALGNPPEAPGIEISRGGLTLELVEGALSVAIAGGGFVVEAAGQRIGSWCVLGLRAGDRLAIRPGPWGSWCCMAVAGWLESPRFMGSAATHAPSGLGGGALRAGQQIAVAAAETRPRREGALPCPVWARPRHQARVVLGPQDRLFPRDAVETFLAARFRLTDAGDRMGQRLAGPAIAPEGALSIPSEPILRGAVQVSGDGVATVLLADHQTTGGYPKIATVIGPDLDGFAQLRPQDPVVFRALSPEAAVAATRQAATARARYLAARP
jgi:5-oxoprolinase (ATP-hydrolysing) subunit C